MLTGGPCMGTLSDEVCACRGMQLGFALAKPIQTYTIIHSISYHSGILTNAVAGDGVAVDGVAVHSSSLYSFYCDQN